LNKAANYGVPSLFNPTSEQEFSGADPGDARLKKRLILISNTLGNAPEADIPDACGSWGETRGTWCFLSQGTPVDTAQRCHAGADAGISAAVMPSGYHGTELQRAADQGTGSAVV
jgi:hypothetical protein